MADAHTAPDFVEVLHLCGHGGAMPWSHAFIGRDRRFGFSGFPTAILVDGAGTIVEVGNALRGERLLCDLEPKRVSAPPWAPERTRWIREQRALGQSLAALA